MAFALLFVRLLLAVVFLIAGLAKLVDLPGSQQALRGFGVPVALAWPMGIVLPIGEMALAAALISQTWARWGALGALGLHLVFIASISYNLAQRRRPGCHCFGRLHSTPVGPSTLARNTLLALAAALVAWFGRGSTALSMTSLLTVWPLAQQAALIVALIAVVLVASEGWLLLLTLRQQGRLLLRIEQAESRLAQAEIVGEIPGQEPPRENLLKNQWRQE